MTGSNPDGKVGGVNRNNGSDENNVFEFQVDSEGYTSRMQGVREQSREE